MGLRDLAHASSIGTATPMVFAKVIACSMIVSECR